MRTMSYVVCTHTSYLMILVHVRLLGQHVNIAHGGYNIDTTPSYFSRSLLVPYSTQKTVSLFFLLQPCVPFITIQTKHVS